MGRKKSDTLKQKRKQNKNKIKINSPIKPLWLRVSTNILWAITLAPTTSFIFSNEKCLKHLMSRTLDQPTWVPGGDHTSGYAREGQNSVVREIKTRMERAKNG